jgi:hypothetical protein
LTIRRDEYFCNWTKGEVNKNLVNLACRKHDTDGTLFELAYTGKSAFLKLRRNVSNPAGYFMDVAPQAHVERIIANAFIGNDKE